MADSPTPRPSWTDQKIGTMVRAALWLVDVVGEGNVFTRAQLRDAFPDVTQIERRVRDLRDAGWVIENSRTQVSLQPNEQLFVQAGDAVWDPAVRAARQRQRAVSSKAGLEQVVRQVSKQTAWERLKDLSPGDRSLVLAWMAMGRRPASAVDAAWVAYSSLSAEDRSELMAMLGELISKEFTEDASAAANSEASS
ncbi:hypothetical protein [Streptomyces sp. NRRL WC-3742]|uniref:hypothetical protein n=1 Tax=Streptomyces sp. NRRL WC-3742 TaxID=1463934 RepID=UPI0004CA698D|nr:hypothetical protein [Streptomyces sp. NRRL WC-3742]